MAQTFSIDASALISTLSVLKSAHHGFERGSERWEKERCRRSPYRALGRQSGGFLGELKAIVWQGQVPFVMFLAQVLVEQEEAPKTVEELLGIRGVGQKIADWVLAYGWGQDALPLDANVYRVLCRIQNGGRDLAAITSELRELLKWSHQEYRTEFSDLSISMVDIHAILRMHGQVCCARKSNCAACPVSNCGSRLARKEHNRSRQITPAS